MPIFISKIKNGKIEDQEKWWVYCQKNDGRKIRVETISGEKRSLTQNGFYWHYLEIIATETGNDADDLHQYFKTKLLPRKIVKIKGKNGVYDFDKLGSTTKLTKVEFGEYIEKICAITQIPIPNPEDVGFIK